MDFELSSEQTMLRDSVQRFVRDYYDFETRKRLLDTKEGFSRENWRKFGHLGWLGITVPEEYGGVGGNMLDMAIVLETFGTALVLEPFLSTAVLGVRLLAQGSSEISDTLLAGIASGEQLVALATHEAAARFDSGVVDTSAKTVGNEWVLNGRKCLVFAGGAADWLIVTARTEGRRDDPLGIALFVVPRDAKGLRVNSYQTLDGLRAADVHLDSVRVGPSHCLAPAAAAWNILDEALDHARIGLCAEAIGAMEQAINLAVEYIKVRKQFGQELANFQVLQHRCADMFVAMDQARSALYQALGALDDEPSSRRWAVSACKVKVSEAGSYVGGQAVHLHGGNGITDEFAVGHYLRRLMLIEKSYGDTEYHLRRCINSES